VQQVGLSLSLSLSYILVSWAYNIVIVKLVQVNRAVNFGHPQHSHIFGQLHQLLKGKKSKAKKKETLLVLETSAAYKKSNGLNFFMLLTLFHFV
jgi:hypothetical protein